MDPTLTCDDVYRTVSPRASSRLADAAGFRTAHARRDTGRHRYATAGFVANTRYCSYETGLARGFAHYDDYQVSIPQAILSSSLGRYLAGSRFVRRKLVRKSAEDVNDEFLGWVNRREDTRPYFVFLNYIDTHSPYQPPAPFDSRFSSPGADKLIEGLDEGDAAGNWPPPVRQAAIDKYDESIAYLDHQLGRLFSELQRRGRWDNTIVILTSDHGEEFGERGVYYHGNSLYRASVEVPLFLRFPGSVPGGHPLPRRCAQGLGGHRARSLRCPIRTARTILARYWNGRTADAGLTNDALLMVFNYTPRLPKATPITKGSMKSVLLNNLRLIRNGDGREELYDFATDRTERLDLATKPEYQRDLQMLRNTLAAIAPVPATQTSIATQ